MKRPLSRSERASKYAEQRATNFMGVYTHRVIQREEFTRYVKFAVIHGYEAAKQETRNKRNNPKRGKA